MSLAGFKKTLKAIVGAIILMAIATPAQASHYTIKAKCSGDYTVYVVDWHGEGLALYVYSARKLLHAKRADERLIENGPRITRVGYSTGSVLDGGADLRIRIRDERIPANEGSAHLSFGREHSLLECSQY